MVACGAGRNHLRAMVRLGLSLALRTTLRMMAIILSHLTCTGPGTVFMVRNGLRAHSQLVPARGSGRMKGPGTLGSSQSANSPLSPSETSLTLLNWAPELAPLAALQKGRL